MFCLGNEGMPVSSHLCTSNFAEGYSARCIRHDLDVILWLLTDVANLKIKWPGTSWHFKFCECYDLGPSSCVRNTPTLAPWQICEVPRTLSMLSMAEGLCCIARNAIETCDSIEGFDPAKPDDGLYRRVPSVYAAVLCSFCPNSFTKFPGIWWWDDAMRKLFCFSRSRNGWGSSGWLEHVMHLKFAWLVCDVPCQTSLLFHQGGDRWVAESQQGQG